VKFSIGGVPGTPETGWTHQGKVPFRALVFSIVALAVPLFATFFAGESLAQYEILIWLPALVPAFLLTYYRGWGGASLALAAAMATLTVAQVVTSLMRAQPWPWQITMTVVTLCVVVCLGIGWIGELLHRAKRKAEAEALRDPLTRLANRGHVNLFLETAIGSAERGGHLVIVLMDLDFFKRINDKHGHSAGDATLVAFAQVLKTHTRRSDLSARFGGEEFIAVLTGPGGVKGARVFAERVREAVRKIPFEWGPVTVSMGVAGYEPGMRSSDPILAAADRALYQAKAAGRDRVAVANEERFEAGRAEFARVETARAEATRLEASRGEGVRMHSAPARSDGIRAEGAQAAAAPERRRGKRQRRRPTGARVLVVAADEIVGEGLCRVLRKAGLRSRSARDGAEALERTAARVPPQLIVADVVMPRMGGLTLAERAREIDPQVRVLLMSGYEEQSLLGVLPKQGVTCVQKPVSREALVDAVRAALSAVPAARG
jgi:diguanylate cyclase (GGDEF)-like protein